MKKSRIILLSLVSFIFALAGLITFVMCLNSYKQLSINLGTVLLWCEDTVLRYNTNLAAKGNVIFVFIISLFVILSFIVYLILIIKKKQYLSLVPLIVYIFAGLVACLSYFYFFYADYNFGLYASVALIDIDYFLVIMNSIGFAIGIACLVFVTIELVQKTRKKYDPLTIYHF